LEEKERKKRVKMDTLIVFKAPRSFKEKLEEYCRRTGYNLSDAIRKAVEDQIIDPKLTWEDLWGGMSRLAMVLMEEIMLGDLMISMALHNLMLVVKEELVENYRAKEALEEARSLLRRYMESRGKELELLRDVLDRLETEGWDAAKKYLEERLAREQSLKAEAKGVITTTEGSTSG
jgi:hypothetical protein